MMPYHEKEWAYQMIIFRKSAVLSFILIMPVIAEAADLPARTEILAPSLSTSRPLIVPFTWTGSYAGVNAGYAFGLGRRQAGQPDQVISFPANANDPGSGFTTDNVAFSRVGTPINVLYFPTELNLTQESRAAVLEGRQEGAETAPALQNTGTGRCKNRSGFTGGGQVGFNYQMTPDAGIVIGLEADAQYTDLGRGTCGNAGITVPASLLGPPLFSSTVAIERNNEAGVTNGRSIRTITFLNPEAGRSGVDWFGTVRGRLGYGFGRVLLYGTGGLAYGEGSGSSRGIRTGLAAGGGVEYALPSDSWLNVFGSSAVTIKLEGLYVTLDRAQSRIGTVIYARDQDGNNYYAPANAIRTSRRSSDDDFVVARIGLNYKF